MSHVQTVFKKRKTKSEPAKQYNNPKEDGLYRICFHCESMFPISDDNSRAALCWHCYLKVLRSGHYLSQQLTPPEWKYYPDAVAQKPKPAPTIKKKITKGYGGGICACGEEFERKTSRQKRCEKCIKESTRLNASDRQRKHRGSA